jgi:hypothetical protein
MANANAPFGARLIESEGKQFRVRRYPKKSGNAIYQGDFVIADAAGSVDVATAAATLLGVALESGAATSTADIAVCDDPEAVFEVQASANFAAADVFQNADIVATAGDSSLSRSKHAWDSASDDTTSTLQLKALGLSQIGENAYGSYAKIKVKINNHAFKAGVAGV